MVQYLRGSTTLVTVLLFAATSLAAQDDTEILPDVPEGAQAVSLTGEALFSPAPSPAALESYRKAKADYEANRESADAIIWLGRRTAYLGDYRGAIRVFSEGIARHPEDARMLRHRGHRYISIREFARAVADLEKAAALIEGTENEVEPDGLPNAQGIPVSSLHGNIWYHLGLAYYLQQDWRNAFRAYQRGFEAGRNDDNRVSTTHWLYSIARRMGDESQARDVLRPISEDMDIIENASYHRLCRFYQGELSIDEMLADGGDNPENAAVAYGVANWLVVSGETDRGYAMLEELEARESWAAFGQIAAEADLAAR